MHAGGHRRAQPAHLTTDEPWRLGHRPALDGVRGIAVLLVVACHAIGWSYDPAGTIGVSMFFTLSGFLITSLLLEELARSGRVSLRAFYERRARRLLPALLMVVAIVVPLQALGGFTDGGEIAPILLYAGNWSEVVGTRMGFLPHLWSLAIEEQFYLVWPVVLVCLARLSRSRALLAVSGAGIVVSLILRFTLWDGGSGVQRVYYGTDTRADGLLIGCALAVAMHRGLRWAAPPGLTVAALGGLAALGAIAGQPMRCLIGPTVAPIVTAGVILVLCSQDYRGPLTSRALTYVGRRSYGLYLWHVPLVYAAPWVTDLPVRTPIALALSLVVTELSWRYVEQPFLQTRPAGDAHLQPRLAAASAGAA